MPAHTPIAIVTPWWTGNTTGGAEFLAREIAHRFAERGRRVEVLTTCGESAFSDWSVDHFAPGAVKDNGLTVRRFPLDPRDQDRFARLHRDQMGGRFLSPAEEREFFENSINSRELCAHIGENRDRFAFLFIPYLYGTTWYGIEAAGDRAILIPCLHDESVAYMQRVREMMERPRGLWFLTEPERRLAQSLYGLHNSATRVVGAGMDFCGEGDADRFRQGYSLDGPYLLFAGRRVPGKGFHLLLDFFQAFSAGNPGWSLVLAGLGSASQNWRLPSHTFDIGCVEKQVLWDAMAGATVFCQPSRYESFSYVLMEAWVQGTPALVNARCEVLRWQCETAGGGLWFHEPDDFEQALRYLEDHPAEAARMGQQGADYVATQLRWSQVMDRAEALLRECGFE